MADVTSQEPGSSETRATRELLDDFEAAWANGPPPSVAAFLARAGSLASEPAGKQLLTELVKIDLEFRWRHAASSPFPPEAVSSPDGLPPRPSLDDYVGRFCALQPLQQLSIDLVCAEFEVRHYWGDQPALELYLRRFPGRDVALREALTQRAGRIAVELAQAGKDWSPRMRRARRRR
jgi:hypothetical protein